MLRTANFVQLTALPLHTRAGKTSNPGFNQPQTQGDTFTRVQSLRFSGDAQRKSSAAGHLNENTALPEQVWCALQNKPAIPASLPLLGRGMESVVYKLSDQFVFRVPIRYEGTNWYFRREDIHGHPDDEHKALRWVHNIGRPVAKVYVQQHPIFFHQLMPGEKASINYNRLTLGGEVPAGEQGDFNGKYKGYLEAVSRFPETSYRKLLWTVHQLDKAGFAIDPGANNLMVDTKKRRFSIVDYKKTSEALENGMFPAGEQNNLAYQMAMLLDMQYKAKIRGSLSPDEGEQVLCRAVLQKTLLAAAALQSMYGASVKLPDEATFPQAHVHDHSCNSFTPQEIFEACGLHASNWEPIRKALAAQEKGRHDSYLKTVEIIKHHLQP